jgi:beta-lactamase regulating signal transducer with metallopeptidase domain/tetratricopeptide (TPR) repeat protein
MTPLLLRVLDAIGSVANWPAIAQLLLQLTVLGALGHLALLLARRRSAALRHLIALVALAALPAVALMGGLPAPWSAWRLKAPIVPSHVAAEKLAAEPAFHATQIRESLAAAAPEPEPDAELVAVPVRAPAPPPVFTRENAAAWLALAFVLVSCLLLLRLSFGLYAAARAARRAIPAEDARLERVLDGSRRRLRIARPVQLTLAEGLGIPVVTGLLRPTLVLPAEAAEWPEERLQAVMLHEVAHVRRGDAGSLMLARLITATLWFHPFAWTLMRQMRRECERACDDVVLASGFRASDYADHLLSIARAAAGRRIPGLTLAFARTSSLEGRLLSVLRGDLRRGPASARVRWGVTLAALLLVLPLSAVKVVGMVTDATEPDGPDATLIEPANKVTQTVTQERTLTKQQTWTKLEEKQKTVSSDDPESDGDVAVPVAGGSGSDLFRRAKQLYGDQRYDEAGPMYEAAARAEYRPDVAWYNAACSYALASDKLAALGALRNAIDEGYEDLSHIQADNDLDSIRGDRRFKLMLEGLRHSDAGEKQSEKALDDYDNLRADNSQDATAWNSAGIELMRLGETDRAIKAFQRRVSLDGSASGIYNQACAEALDGRTGDALASLERSLVAGFNGGRDKLATDSDLASLRNEPDFRRLMQLADELTLDYPNGNQDDPRDWKQSLAHAEAAADRHPELGRAWFNLGFTQIRAGRSDDALQSFQRALDKGYRRPTTMYNLACASAQVGDADAAMRWLGKAEEAGMDMGNVRNDEDLDPLHSDPRFQAMIERMGFGHSSKKVKNKEG